MSLRILVDMNLSPEWVDALGRAGFESVIQVRADDVLPEHLGDIVITALRMHASQLASGALVTIDERSQRVRILPLKR